MATTPRQLASPQPTSSPQPTAAATTLATRRPATTVATSRTTPSPTRQATGTLQGISTVDLTVSDLAYSSATGKIYASVPGSVPGKGNSVVAIDPASGAVGQPLYVGSEPTRLAPSDDGRYLYVALDGAAAIARVNLATWAVDLQFPLGNDKFYGPLRAEELVTVPGKPNMIVASLRRPDVSPRHGGVAAYLDGNRLPDITPDHTGSNSIQFCGSGGFLFGYNNETTEFGLRVMGVSDSGVKVVSTAREVFTGFYHRIRCGGDRLYSTSGQVVSAQSQTLVGTFQGLSTPALVAPDATAGVTYFVTAATTSNARPGFKLVAYDSARFVPLWSADLPGIAESDGTSGVTPSALIRWGADGLALRSGPTQVMLIRAPQGAPQGTPTAPPASSSPRATPQASPSPGGVKTTVANLATNDLVFDPKAGRIYASIPSSGGAAGNSVAILDPITGALEQAIPVGSEPNRLALSRDSRYLYVGLDGAAAISRIDLTTRQVDLQFSLGSGSSGPRYPGQIVVSPDDPATIAVVRRYRNVSPSNAGVALFTNGEQRPEETRGHTDSEAITFCSSGDLLYGGDNGTLYVMGVSASGVTISSKLNGLGGVGNYVPDIRCEGDALYFPSGRVIDTKTFSNRGTYADVGYQALVLPDPARGQVYFASQLRASLVNYRLDVFDLATYRLVTTFTLPTFDDGSVHPANGGGARALIRCGDDCLALRSVTQVLILRSATFVGKP
ncbi:MAG: hypothetical protein U0232_32530 [Thermomicrobiales bacterium]